MTRYKTGIALATASFLTLGACAGDSHFDEAPGEREPEGEHAASVSGEPAADEERGEHATREADGEHEGRQGRGEHGDEDEHGGAREHDEGGGEGEESGVYIGRGETWDATRNGARLVLRFDPASNVFSGTVENRTDVRLCAVRVEVHLAGGPELGPTERTDVPAGESIPVTLTATEAFETWTAHPEISTCG